MSQQLESEPLEPVFSKFIEKINFLKRLKSTFQKLGFGFYNRLVSECVFWAISILEIEVNDFKIRQITEADVEEIASKLKLHQDAFEIDKSSFSKSLQNRYKITAESFARRYSISFHNYLVTSEEFKDQNRKELERNIRNTSETSFDELRLNKPEPSSITIVDICRQMERHRFLIRPPYQRVEVINKNKSSAIIESILLGIKLPPIFVYKRSDGVSEVLDGQQRLLSILGFLKKEYLDENNERQKSNKHGYSLSLNNGILKELNGKNVDNLSPDLVKKINNFDLWIIEINYRYNKDFEPIDLFLRLNSKPYPIKENTFEMWNSYIDKEIVGGIKALKKNNSDWFYFRKIDSRMENENIFTALVYLQYYLSNSSLHQPLDYYRRSSEINFRVKSKDDITRVLEDSSLKPKLVKACDDVEQIFIAKVKNIVMGDGFQSWDVANRNLEAIFDMSTPGRRTQQKFYALWFFLSKISLEATVTRGPVIRADLATLFRSMNKVESKELFADQMERFWKKFNK